jgi:hypothetical protein
LAFQNQNANAAVASCRAIIGQDEDQSRSLGLPSPHLTIKIITPPAASPAPVVVEHQPVEKLGDDPHDPTRQLRQPFFRDPTDPDR